MFINVIAGVDGFDGGRDAAALARALGSERVTLVHSYPADGFPSRAYLAGYEGILREDAVRVLEATRLELATDAEIVAVPDGSPARALQHAAQEAGADLIVVGSAHRGAVGRVLLGDVGRAVLHDAPCPVAVTPKRFAGGPPRSIAVAFDGSDEARAALDLARRLAAERGAALTVLVAWQTPQVPIAVAGASPATVAELADDARSWADRLLADTLAELPGAAGRVLHGPAATELEQAAAAFDLLVVGSRGWGPVRRIALGSTSDHLVHHAPCPVLVVPRPAVTADAPPAVETAATATG
jgi:nucleotide-binding universal stress UspA family protein